jgi:hypothetical protein
MRAVRLGDDIDDYCVKCKRVMNHSVVSIVNDAAAKVRCRTCHSDHDFRNEQPPPPKPDSRKTAASTPAATDGVSSSASPDDDAAARETPAAAAETPKPRGRKKAKA